ncbi:hypothetical protein [Streptomyces sp. NPDC091215]|uniref:hypothetical protein n=1 Tax=Streptomyces sp. NPDC091215 TaxID=3155192 RepID=UPI0034459D2A
MAGLHDYIESLALRAGQGRSTDEAVLTLFMAGLLQPRNTPCVNELTTTHIASVRRALNKWIASGDRDRDRISSVATDGSYTESALDAAYSEAEKVSKRRTSKAKVAFDRIGAELSGTTPRTREEIRTAEEQAYLSAAQLWSPLWDHIDDERRRAEIWGTDSAPLDANIFRNECQICTSRTKHMAGSLIGQREILASACFCEINRARAIGGAISMLVAGVRDAAHADPSDSFAQAAVQLIANTVFRFLLRDIAKVSPDQPGSIAPCTLFFLHDCRLLRSAAATLMQLAIWKIETAEDSSAVVAVARAMDEVFHRPSILRSADGIGMLLTLDGTLEADELLQSNSAHCHSSCIDRVYTSAFRQ